MAMIQGTIKNNCLRGKGKKYENSEREQNNWKWPRESSVIEDAQDSHV